MLIDGADINVTATGGDSGGTGIIADNIDIRNSSVYAEGTGDQYGIFCASALTISDSSVESGCTGTYGRGLYFSDEENFTVSGDSFVTLEGGTRYGALWIKGNLITENGNEIVEPANYIIDPLETGSDVYLVYDVTADEKIPAVNVIITNPLTITVTANPTGGGTITGGGKTYKGADVALTAAPETGYDFVSWTEGNSVVSTNAKYSFTVEQSRNLVANFKLQVKSVSVSANPTEGGTVTGGGTYDYGSSATVTATPKDHYHFVNWTENGEEVSTDAEYTFTVDKDRNLTANFELDTFTITFENDDGTPLQSGSVAYGETPIYEGDTPTKGSTPEYSYTFAGWSPEIAEVTGDATYTATYTPTPVDYKITWQVDGESYKNETIPFGSNVSAPEVDEKEGYTFEWVDEIPETMPAQDVTINGEYTAIKYTATFVKEDGTELETREYDVETTSIDEPAVPEKAGYTGKWEKYEFTIGGITVKPVYTKNYKLPEKFETQSAEYKTFVTVNVTLENVPDDAKV
ncbi:MAG: InlB B-repeat-containing protein, partial [Clostridia bacterium]|nr:InlB B-repeat-containing protein [Clostridia bacterium]